MKIWNMAWRPFVFRVISTWKHLLVVNCRGWWLLSRRTAAVFKNDCLWINNFSYQGMQGTYSKGTRRLLLPMLQVNEFSLFKKRPNGLCLAKTAEFKRNDLAFFHSFFIIYVRNFNQMITFSFIKLSRQQNVSQSQQQPKSTTTKHPSSTVRGEWQ